MQRMNRAQIDGIELAYELRGAGEPVVLIHWGVASAWAEPLLREPGLAESYRLLSYHRAGFGDSSRVTGPISMADHARHCSLLLRRLEIDRAHIVGHSSSAAIALQLALDFPEAVGTMVLMDAARPVPATEMQQEFVRTFVAPAVELYRAGDRVAAVDTFLRGVFGADYREPLEKGLPGAFDRCVEEADAFFAQELPALQAWSLTREDAARVDATRALRRRGDTRPRPFRSAGSCCSRCFPTLKRSTFPERRTSCIWRTRRGWRRRWPPSSRGIRSPFMPDCVSPGRMGRMFIERPTSEGADGPGWGVPRRRGTRMNPRGRSVPGRGRTSARRFEVGSSRLGPSRRFGYSPAYDGIRASRRASSSRPISRARVAPFVAPRPVDGRPHTAALDGWLWHYDHSQPSAAEPRPPEPTSWVVRLVGHVLDACGALVTGAGEYLVDSLTGDAERAGKLGLARTCLVCGEQGAAEVAPAPVEALKRVECFLVRAEHSLEFGVVCDGARYQVAGKGYFQLLRSRYLRLRRKDD